MAPSITRKLAYQTFVRPQLEYASSIWSPHQAYLIDLLESVQNRAARFIARDYNRYSSVTNMKASLSLPSLELRRKIATLCLFHKVIYSTHVNTLPLSKPHRTSRRLHNQHSFVRHFGRTQASNASALARAIVHWNNLPDDVVCIRDHVAFRNKILTIYECVS